MPGSSAPLGGRCVLHSRGSRPLTASGEALSRGVKGRAGKEEGWRMDLNTRRRDRNPGANPIHGHATSRVPAQISRRPTDQAQGAPQALKQKQRAPPPEACPLHTEPSWLRARLRGSVCQRLGGSARPRPGQATCTRQPELTYSSRVSQLLAALARGIQIDVFTLTSFLTGVFTLGETG